MDNEQLKHLQALYEKLGESEELKEEKDKEI